MGLGVVFLAAMAGMGVRTAVGQRPAEDVGASGLGQQIEGIVTDPAVVRAHWGVEVESVGGEQIFGLNEGQVFQPASNTKLFTTSAAMAILGPDKTFETKVLGTLDRKNGQVMGDLVLKGGGDANFDSGDLPYVPPAQRPKHVEPGPHVLQDIDTMADEIVAKGVKVVDGDVVGDDTLFP